MALINRIDTSAKCRMSFGTYPTLEFWIRSVTPPGVDMGGPIDLTNQSHTAVRTAGSKTFKKITPVQAMVQFSALAWALSSPGFYHMGGVNQLITITFPDGSTYVFWGFLDKFTPPAMSSDEDDPIATIVVEPTNLNASKVETVPVFTAA